MAAPWRRVLNPSLETQPWKFFCIDGKTFLAKGYFTESSYSVLLTDLGVMWEEFIDEDNLLERSKSLNPYIEAPPSVIIQTLSHRLLEGPLNKCTYTTSLSDNQLTVSVSGPLQRETGPEYQWNFNLSKAPSLVLKHQLIHPILSMSVELLRQQNKLVGIVEKKDKEIKDYKENGAVISRKHLETLPFEEKGFHNDMVLTKEFQVSSVNPLVSLDTPWQELYRDLSLCRNWFTTNSGLSPPSTDGMEASVPTGVSPTTSPSKSPRKRPLVQSPSQDVEKLRRQELEKQLEDGKTKNKKKRKKLM